MRPDKLGTSTMRDDLECGGRAKRRQRFGLAGPNPKRRRAAVSLATSILSTFLLAGCGQADRQLTQSEIQEAARFFGGNLHFTADQVATIHDPAARKDAPAQTITNRIAFSEGKQRNETMASPGAVAFITVLRPDRNAVYSIWPAINVAVVEEYSGKGGQSLIQNPVKEKTEIGEETLDGRRCIKCKVITQGAGAAEWTSWEAIDLNRFPVRAEYVAGRKIMRVEFSNVKLAKPDASLFEVPKGYKRFKNKLEAYGYMMQIDQKHNK